uniref:Uncharacterized protein n=1 Tax=Anguilla anguilla TaxID=7936 RepID=A0A0E9PE89_ANGAN
MMHNDCDYIGIVYNHQNPNFDMQSQNDCDVYEVYVLKNNLLK